MATTIKIPRRPIQRVEGLKKDEMDCLNWYVIFGDPIEECYARFVAPQFRDNPKLLREYAKQFMASAGAKEYIAAYKDELDVLAKGKSGRAETQAERAEGESDEDFNTRRKRDSIEKIMEKIAEMVDTVDVSDAETLLDTIKAMKDTGYFDNVSHATPPRRYLPETCNECEYKKFIDEHVKSGDIEEVKESDDVENESKTN